MTKEQDEHCDSIMIEATERIRAKYDAGVKEHGGNLWEQDGLLEESINEVIDLLVYLLTFKQQLKDLSNKEEYETI